MASLEDDDIRLHKASGGLITDILKFLKVLLWRPSGVVHRLVRTRDLDRTISLLEPFQEEPQLLDPQLKHIVPQLVEAFLLQLNNGASPPRAGTSSIALAICKVLYTLCKIRGEKVIVGFFNHDPPNVDRILSAYEVGISRHTWEERYILMLWLWHLMLIPFDLQTLTDKEVDLANLKDRRIVIPRTLPPVAQRIILVCVEGLSSATKERDAAAKLLVRLSIRGDVREHALLQTVSPWAVQSLRTEALDPSALHQKLGLLSFLSQFTASASPIVAAPFLHHIYTTCQAILSGDLNASLGSNAVARKQIIKIYRNIVLLCLQSPEAIGSIDVNDALSEVIESLLSLVGDSDTPVRYAASKALSAITLKLDPAMATEVIEAVLACLQEDLITDSEGRKSTSAVNALRWHGLTLALAQLLYKRAPSTNQLLDVLQALVRSLEFSQRSAAGVAIGTNVRDAACFGIWALSRRYTTSELLVIDRTNQDPAVGDTSEAAMKVPEWLATRLLAAACLDPSGNIRRGSSAALQELIGRHPDANINDRITLVQVVEYQAVGLRRRAMAEVCPRAAGLNDLYWKVLYSELHGERAMLALDEASRGFAAEAIGLLCKQRGMAVGHYPVQHLTRIFERMGPSITVQERQGILLALAAVLDQFMPPSSPVLMQLNGGSEHRASSAPQTLTLPVAAAQMHEITPLLDLPHRDFTSSTRSPQLTAFAVCCLVLALTSMLAQTDPQTHPIEAADIIRQSPTLVDLCLARTESAVLDVIPQCVSNIMQLSREWQSLVQTWLATSSIQNRVVARETAHALALGAAFDRCRTEGSALTDEIVDALAARCSTRVDVESRVIAVRAVGLALSAYATSGETSEEADIRRLQTCTEAMHTALNDYTINERGDVGSLVRLEALSTLERLFQQGWNWKDKELHGTILRDIVRLCLERLDKVRLLARKCIVAQDWACPAADQISSSHWFAFWLNMLHGGPATVLGRSVLEGLCSSAGLGTEGLVQASRAALVAFLTDLPATESVLTESITMLDIANDLAGLLRDTLGDERVLLPLLETLAFLLDMQILQRLIGTSFKWRTLLVLVQKSHYQSKSIPKILLALDIYRSLAEVPDVRTDVIKKLKDMSRNPMITIKRAVEETLYVVEAIQ